MNENKLREIEIEKLACAVCKAVFNNGECGSCQHLLKSKVIARKLFDNGVRKIQDGEVVLTKEEYYEWLDESGGNAIKRITEIGEAIDKARKEMAREIFADIERTFHDFYSKNSILTCYDALNHIAFVADKYGVEVEV